MYKEEKDVEKTKGKGRKGGRKNKLAKIKTTKQIYFNK
jgi:hypothetical protein